MSFVLQAPAVVHEDAILRPGYVAISEGLITAVGKGAYRDGQAGCDRGGRMAVVETGGTVAAGFVDLHVHGGDGAQVNGGSAAETIKALERISRFHVRHGTTSFLATTVSDTSERLASTVAGVAAVARRRRTTGSRLLGVHLEGPWISPARRGAQDPSALRLPDRGELRALLEAGEGCVRMVTLAPELPGAEQLIEEAAGAEALVAIGHTNADFETARHAFDAGARHVSHLFNAMAPIHHRRPGAVTAALLDERVTLEVIADLEHVHPEVLKLTARLAPGRLVAVSDAVSAAGLGPGAFRLGPLEITVAAGRVSLTSDSATLAGSTLTLDRAIANLVSAVGLPLEAALAAGSAVPGRALGMVGRFAPGMLGRLAPGAPADIVVLAGADGDDASGMELDVVATLVGGQAVWDPAGIFAGTEAGEVGGEVSGAGGEVPAGRPPTS